MVDKVGKDKTRIEKVRNPMRRQTGCWKRNMCASSEDGTKEPPPSIHCRHEIFSCVTSGSYNPATILENRLAFSIALVSAAPS